MSRQRKLLIGLTMTAIIIAGCKSDPRPGDQQVQEPMASTSISSQSHDSVESEEPAVPVEGTALVYDDHGYDYDVVTGATVTTFGTNPDPLYTYEDKLAKMFWSSLPPLGLLEGNYYRNEGDFDGGNHGIVEIVTDQQGDILNVEFNEFARPNYYEAKYAGAHKRLSDYAFFQAKDPRVDYTLVTMVNGVSFVEQQMRKENRVEGNFETVNGSSTSARNGLMPLALEMKDWIRTPHEATYQGYSETFSNGMTGRLELVFKDGKIAAAIYDEYFANFPEEITDRQLKAYYRQSKYYSLDYNEKTGGQFIDFADKLTRTIVKEQTLAISDPELEKNPSFQYYRELADKLSESD